MVVLRWGITVLRRRAIILIPRLSFISRQLKECDRSLTSPGCRLVILGGNPDLLDPVLGQLSGHSAQHTRTEPLIFRGKVAKRRKKKVPVRLALFLPGASSVQAEWTGPLTMSAELSEPGLICRCAAHIRYLTPPGREATWLRWRHADAIQTAHTHIHTRRERLPRRPLVVALFIRTLISLSVTYHGI